MARMHEVYAWDRSVRLFHWINVLCVLGLVAIGTVILNGKALGVSADGKILLKQVHVWIGYVFVVNLLWRLLWGFAGSRYARWSNILPFSGHFWSALRADLAARRAGQAGHYIGHNPVGRLMVTALLLLLLLQAGTGLVLAATDLYQGPFGGLVSASVAADGVDPAALRPGDKTGVDPERYEAMRGWRKPVVETHEWVFFILLGLIALHILAVVVAEIREGGSLVSAMITGRKWLPDNPEDKA